MKVVRVVGRFFVGLVIVSVPLVGIGYLLMRLGAWDPLGMVPEEERGDPIQVVAGFLYLILGVVSTTILCLVGIAVHDLGKNVTTWAARR